MNLKTTYMGFDLKSPLMPGASPLMENLDTVRSLEDGGASAIVMYSLFEEQLLKEQMAMQAHMDTPAESFGEATSLFPDLPDFAVGPEEYLEAIRKTKEAVGVPVIGSLNGSTPGGWIDYAKRIEEAGADGLELNIYFLGTSFEESGADVDDRCIQVVEAVKKAIGIPVAVKIGPYFSSTANVVHRLDETGADAVVLFNRFYQPDIDVEKLEVTSHHSLSTSEELRLRLRWLALLSYRVKASLAVTGGVHSTVDIVKSIMAGAHGVQLVSVLLKKGPDHIKQLTAGLIEWMEKHEYESVEQMCGSMNLRTSPDPAALTRANYMEILKGWKI